MHEAIELLHHLEYVERVQPASNDMIGDAQIDIIPVDPDGLIIPSVIFESIRDSDKRISSIGNSILNGCVAVQIHSLSSITTSRSIEDVEHLDRVHMEDSPIEDELDLLIEKQNGNWTPNRLHSTIDQSNCEITGVHNGPGRTSRVTLTDQQQAHEHPTIHQILGFERPTHPSDD